MGIGDNHTVWMRRALALAARGEGQTRPNPPVGAVLVRNGTVIGEGYHRKAGGPHAEVVALRGLTPRQTRGTTLYVTLEPCSTHGRTPPCVDAILAAGISEVVVSVKDPNRLHAGRGLRLLRRRGVKVTVGICREEGAALLAPFAKWIASGMPYLTLKMAMTLDGRIADASGKSRWITGAAARREVQQLRRHVDAVLVGAGTAGADDPSLLVLGSKRRQPLRVVLDGAGRIPLTAKVLSDGYPTIVVVSASCAEKRQAALAQGAVRVWCCGAGARVDMELLLRRLGQEGILHVLCEGGGELAGALLRAQLVDVCRFYIAGRLLGGNAVPVTGMDGWLLGAAPHLRLRQVRQVGEDVCVLAEPAKTEA